MAGLGPLTGLVTGVGPACCSRSPHAGWHPGPVVEAGLATGLELLGSNGPMTALGVTDPRPASSWVSDVVPHLACESVTAGVLRGLADGQR